MQVVNKPTKVEASRWIKIAMVKACKAFGVTATVFEHKILEIILRIEKRDGSTAATQQQHQAKAAASPKKGKNKREIELEKLV